jgi:AbrB family looped-hinge helix DNA binding protein
MRIGEADQMPLVKVKDKFQVTIPASIRKAVELDIGDLLEAEVRENGILLIPKTIMDRKALVKKFKTVFSKGVSDNAFAKKNDEALMKIAIKEIKETRTAKRSKK